MNRTRIAALAAPLAAGALALSLAAPAQADDGVDSFVSTLGSSGLGDIDPATAAQVGQSVCPMLADPGQQAADAAAHVADTLGQPLGPATMFTGLAIQAFCPGAVAALANGNSPLPFGLPGF
ncbi:DUF732 domain-containing protein [Mycolicibacterium fluoranthenivorans]|jgi:hypothetical protein|uniref:DUF732 domain-containing protein n=1 Tax=Mycolicibacterium fluoranthenivorans TaxID=258505 RepID=A0A1G4WY81_9MYCO|nr:MULTISPECIES: DUF732 domain-containing protein [Mycobacteriaceae]MCV7255809.1 DUF732 domain-containing protein [Mycobacterium hackensackense]QNJ92037.1 DUF732 domain-containing protein [Mycolicibacterium fluoranthenivorans]SCX32165.1 Protein of unknown function [Mycolicibacterium fluoranthenivorans]